MPGDLIRPEESECLWIILPRSHASVASLYFFMLLAFIRSAVRGVDFCWKSQSSGNRKRGFSMDFFSYQWGVEANIFISSVVLEKRIHSKHFKWKDMYVMA